MAEIIISPKSHSQNDNNYSINFDSIDKNSVLLDLSIIGVSKQSFVYWEIFSNGNQLDLGDLTTGHKAELKILKSYSSSKDRPHIFTIIAKDKEKQEITRKTISVYATPKVEKAYWSDFHSKIDTAFINTQVYIYIEGKGLYQSSMILKIYDEKGKNLLDEEIKVNHLEQDIIVSLDIFYRISFLQSILHILIQNNINKIFFTLTSKEGETLYKSDYLYITTSIFEKKHEEKKISPVVIYDEEYFTQRYEPCKYESIFYTYGEQAEVLFAHNKPTQKKGNNYNIDIIAGNSLKGQKLEIIAGKSDTRECQYNDKNRFYTTYRSAESKENSERKYKNHKGNIFDEQTLLENGIINEEKNKEEILKFVPVYPYPKDDWQLLKQTLFGDVHVKEIEANTCRYQKKITLNIFPDILWTFHFKLGYQGDYFFDEKLVDDKKTFLVKGIDNYESFVREQIDYFSQIFSWIREVEGLVDFIVKEANKVSFGLHTWYNNRAEKIDYTRKYQNITEAFICYTVFYKIVLQIVLEVLAVVLTRGRSAAKYIKKMRKWMKDHNLEFIYPAVAMNSAFYYEKQSDGRIAQIVEFNLKADPLIGIRYESTITLEELIKNQQSLGNKGINSLAKVIGEIDLQASITVKIDGILAQEYNLKINTLTNEQKMTAIIGNYLVKNKTTYTEKNAISIFVNTKGYSSVRINDFKGELQAEGNAKGIISYSRSYGKDEEGIWIQDIITLSKVEGMYMGKMVAKYKNEKLFDTNPEETPTPFIVFEGKEIKLPKVYVLKI